MSDNPTLGFGKFVPGFDFMQSLVKNAGSAMPKRRLTKNIAGSSRRRGS